MLEKFNRSFKYRTRGVTTGLHEAEGYLQIPDTEKAITKKGIMVRGPTLWNQLPRKLRIFGGSLQSFKNELKKWIKKTVEP